MVTAAGRPVIQVLVCAAGAILLALGGVACRSDTSVKVEGAHQPMPEGGVDFGAFNAVVRPRLGGLPYTGSFTLFEVADPKYLGRHSYATPSRRKPNEPRETHRGVIYTCRGGFIDLAHLRKSADLCKYASVRIEFALLNDWTAIRLKAIEPTIYTLRFEYPAFWKLLTPERKRVLARELAIRMGQQMGYLMINWHEVLTFFGYRATAVLPEFQSAFTWDDTGSHAIGVETAGRALRDDKHNWGDAMSLALQRMMNELGALQPDQTLAAVAAVEGKWWANDNPLRRQVDFGLDGYVTRPWLVPGFEPCAGTQPAALRVPTLDDVHGADFRGFYRVEIDPRVHETGAIRDAIPGRPELLDAHEHIPILVEHMRQKFLEIHGPGSLDPD